jgi:AraC-like DNA-binding protein
VVLLTASQSVQNELQALQYGVDAYVAKPFNSALLLQRIQNLVSQRKELAKSYASNWDLDPKIDLTPIESQFLEKVQRLLQEALTQPDFNATAMAEKLGVSRMQLHRKLQAYTGQSTSAFIRSQRLKLAKDLLTKGELTVSEVAYASGFNTPSYFMKSFKAQYGMTPSEFVTQQDFR